MSCDCKSYKDNIDKVNGPIILEGLRYGTKGYSGEHFRFCPWCGKPLLTNDAEPPDQLRQGGSK